MQVQVRVRAQGGLARLDFGEGFRGSLFEDADDEGPTKDDLNDGDAEEELDAPGSLCMRDGLARGRARIWKDYVSQTPEKKEGVGSKAVQKDAPVDQASHLEQADQQGDKGAYKLVARVGEEVHHGVIALDVEEVGAKFDCREFDKDDGKRARGAQAEHFGVEARFQPENDAGEDDVGNKCHGGDVEVGRVDVVARWKVAFGARRSGLDRRRRFRVGRRHASTRGRVSVRTRPRFVSPREEDDAQLVKYVRVGNVKVVLEHRYGQKSAKVLLDILASNGSHVLAELDAHLSGSIVHDLRPSLACKNREASPALLLSVDIGCACKVALVRPADTGLRIGGGGRIGLVWRRMDGWRCESLITTSGSRLKVGSRTASSIRR